LIESHAEPVEIIEADMTQDATVPSNTPSEQDDGPFASSSPIQCTNGDYNF